MPTNLDSCLFVRSPSALGQEGPCSLAERLMYISQGRWRTYGCFLLPVRDDWDLSSCSWPQHEVLAAVAVGKYVILCKCAHNIYVIITHWVQPHRFQGGHTNTERGYLPILAAKLHHELQASEFEGQDLRDVEVLVSQTDRHPLEFVWNRSSEKWKFIFPRQNANR